MSPAYQILIYSVSYIFFFSLLWLSRIKKGNRLTDKNGLAANKPMLIVLHVGGALILGSSFCFLKHRLPDIVFGKRAATDLQIATTFLFVILAMIIAPMLAKKDFRQMKHIRSTSHSFHSGFIANYFFVRILFLCVYEVWFRGYLLTDCINGQGIAEAILLNIILYALLHSVNGKNEMMACIPFGLLLCFLCIWIGAAWPAIIVHLSLAISYEVYLVRKINNPLISLV